MSVYEYPSDQAISDMVELAWRLVKYRPAKVPDEDRQAIRVSRSLSPWMITQAQQHPCKGCEYQKVCAREGIECHDYLSYTGQLPTSRRGRKRKQG